VEEEERELLFVDRGVVRVDRSGGWSTGFDNGFMEGR
jgi:hypothetical protein